ncbi:RNA polymerase sigma factor [Rufibacter sp. LB8]|uniref:RNA polymerase sigma factor n=1 Tax=Rufibacter sp. LB8 TaxID=2777781 RepID=UPI00178C7F53|nr:sigma-70 family RNA polymerase sigma factor [Rufibacter sp. LB8]
MFLKLFSRSPQPPTDQELVLAYQQAGDLAVVGQLFERHTEMVYLVCLKYLKDEDESKDATMQVFENLIGLLKKHEVANFKSWLHSIAKNHCLMLLRSRSRAATNSLEETPPTLLHHATEPDFSEPNGQELELQALQNGLSQLGPEQRLCVELFYLQQKSYKDIAALTGFDINKVKSHIQNGKRNLTIYMKKNHEQE